MKYKTLIIDDEELARKRLVRLLEPYSSQIDIIGQAADGKEAIEKIDELQPDLIFLDIEMPVFNGFDVLRKIIHDPVIIFTTAYEDYAIKAFEKNSIDYLLKPVEKDRLQISMEKLSKQTAGKIDKVGLLEEILTQKPSHSSKAIPVKIGDKVILVKYDEITFFEANEKYVEINTIDQHKFIIELSLNNMELKLPSNFQRIHRSYIVNMDQLKEFRKGFNGSYTLVIKDKEQTKLQSGRTYTEALKKWMEW